jgi:hypothetical protein
MERDKINIFEKISLWWEFDGRYYHKDFIQGVKNLWKWFPVIWKNRDWDHTFIYELIKVKLEFQAEYIGGKNRHTRAKRDAEIMKLTSRLIQRCQDDHYDMEYMDYNESEFNWLDVFDRPDLKELDIIETSETYSEYFAKYPNMLRRVIRMESPVFELDGSRKAIAMNIAYYNNERCHELLFKLMERNIRRWWD